MRNYVSVVISIVLLFSSSLAFAVRVHSIYQAEIIVPSQAASVKFQAAQDALAEVFRKVSGNNLVFDDNSELKKQLVHAKEWAQFYKYSSLPNTSKEKSYSLTIRFDIEAVNRALREAGIPIWGQKRPLILVWLVLDTPSHPSDIVDSSTMDIQTLLKQSAAKRGLPVILPMMDMTDISKVSSNDLLKESTTVLQIASQRYRSEAILIGNVKGSKKDFTGQWQLVLGPDQWTWDVTGKSLQDVFSNVVNKMADTLAEHYAPVLPAVADTLITLKVAGIKQQSSLMQLMKYLQHLAIVGDVQLTSVVDGNVTLEVSSHGDKQALTKVIAQDKKLEVTAGAASDEDIVFYKLAP